MFLFFVFFWEREREGERERERERESWWCWWWAWDILLITLWASVEVTILSKVLAGFPQDMQSNLNFPMSLQKWCIFSIIFRFVIFREARSGFITLPNTMHEKCPYWELLWSGFPRIWVEYSGSLRIQSKCEKMPTRITPNTDTCYAVTSMMALFCENS